MNLSRDERLRLIERENEELSMRIQVELLSVNRSGVYYQPQPPSAAEVQLKHALLHGKSYPWVRFLFSFSPHLLGPAARSPYTSP